MSNVHTQRLRAVNREYDAAREAVGYVINHWDAQDIYNELPGLTLHNFKTTNEMLERTYFIRLFAEFEGILKDHLDTNHPAARWKGRLRADMRDKLEVNENISLVVREDHLRLTSDERQRLLDVRDYRNSIAHLNLTMPPIITFGDALSRLNTFVAGLPAPLS